MSTGLASFAGMLATLLYVLASLPMLYKAARTRDLRSYSGANLVMANAANAAQTIYVATLPPGPLWLLHAFNTATAAVMLTWWLMHRPRDRCPSIQAIGPSKAR